MIIEVKGERISVKMVPGSERFAACKNGSVYALHARWRTTWHEVHGYTNPKMDRKTGKMVNVGTLYVKIDCKERLLNRVIWETFVGPVENKYAIYHKNGNKNDNSLDNLEKISRVRLGRKTGHKGTGRTVVKINEKKEALEVYRSAREAGKANAMSPQSVRDRCEKERRPKKEFCFGFSFRYENRNGEDDEE